VSRKTFGGVIAPIATPFDEATGEIAPVVLRRVARALMDAGIDGIAVAGSTGEGELLDERERIQMVEWLRDVVPDECVLIAGTGAESTRAAVRSAREAGRAGADAVLVRPPAYFGTLMSPQAFAQHYQRLADDSPVPVIVYNIPRYTHIALQDSVLRALGEHRNVAGFKDSSGDLKVFSAFHQAAPRLVPLMGSGHLFYPALELGAQGGILAMACFAPAPCVELLRAFRNGDKVAAGSLQEKLNPVAREIVGALGPAGIKAAMDVVGLSCGPVRSPLCEVDNRQRAKIRELLSSAGLKAAA